jgi:dienelactone hydrolase
MRIQNLAAALLGLSLLLACNSSNDGIDEVVETGGVARFNPDPSDPQLPFPTNVLFSGSLDGTINIPGASNAAEVALSALDGFSTVAPITTTFSAPLDGGSLAGGENVRIFQVETQPLSQGGAVTRIVAELKAGLDYTLGPSPAASSDPDLLDGATLQITLLRPLKPQTSYLVALTKGIRLANGGQAVADSTYNLLKSTAPLVNPDRSSATPLLSDAQAQALEPLRQLVNQSERVLEGAGISRVGVILSWTFTTQSIGVVLATVRALARAAPVGSVLVDAGVDSPLAGQAGFVGADVFVGTLNGLPYYLTPAADLAGPQDPGPVTTPWQAANTVGGERNLTALNPLPAKVSDENIPLMVSIPKGPKPASGWPVVVFQHGITRNRSDMLAVADALANAGFAVVAIDLPLHGLTGNETDGSQAFFVGYDPDTHTGERTFDLDLTTGATPGLPPDGIIDPSGTWFINLSNLLVSRDNLRQGAGDLVVLVKALAAMDYDGGGADFDTTRVRFLGHSLGGIVGGVFLALEDGIGAATLSVPGGGIAKLIDGSPSLGPPIAAGLEQATGGAVKKGFQSYEDFLRAVQSAVDTGDPLNYAQAAVTQRGLLMFEVIGGNTSPPDQVIPNDVLTAQPPAVAQGTLPGLGGTDPLAAAMGLTQLSETTTGADLQAIVRYTAGHHSSLLTPNGLGISDPATAAAVNREMQAEMAGFLASDGATLQVGDPTVIEPASGG